MGYVEDCRLVKYMYIFFLYMSMRRCDARLYMGVAWVGILPRQGTGGSVPQKLSTFLGFVLGKILTF